MTGDLQNKIETGELLPDEAIKDLARDGVVHAWEDEGVHLPPEERGEESQKKLKAEAIDGAIELASLHHRQIAPMIKPAYVQKKWVIELTGFPVDLCGTMDIQEDDLTIRDTKTTGKRYDPSAAATSDQLTMYAMAQYADNKVIPDVVLDILLKTKRLTECETQRAKRTVEHFKKTLRRVEIMVKNIEKGDAYPTGRNTWLCCPKWCGFYPCEHI